MGVCSKLLVSEVYRSLFLTDSENSVKLSSITLLAKIINRKINSFFGGSLALNSLVLELPVVFLERFHFFACILVELIVSGNVKFSYGF